MFKKTLLLVSTLLLTNASPSLSAIVADHTTTNRSAIPDTWINVAKNNLRLSYGHTSHGSQPISGMDVLVTTFGNLYSFNSDGGIFPGTLSLHDYAPDGDLGHNGDTTWAANTRAYLNTVGGTGATRNVVIWSWCGGVSDNTPEGIDTYLNTMNQLELDYPLVTFVYMTGHLDGTGSDGNLHLMNERIRTYCRTHNKILFDFADIESYDPSGNYYLNLHANDNCDYDGGHNWAIDWCAGNPGHELCAPVAECAHSQSLNCNLKARAFWWLLARIAGWTGSNQAGARLGASVSTAGDVNGDGFSDVIVGAPLYDNGQADEGRVFVYYGSASGLATTADWTAEGNQAGAYFGFSVSTAGRVNGDRFADIIVGAYGYDNGQMNEGRAFVYHGSASGLEASPAWWAESNQTNAYFGNSVSTAGDVNGDGFADVIVGALFYDNGQTNEGRAFVYHGSAGGLATTANWTAEVNQAGALFGTSVSTAGNVNGDGFSDVLVGSVLYDNGQTDEGGAFVYHGSAGGLATTANWSAEGNQVRAYFGYSVSTAGDVNDDTYADIIVGAYGFDNGETNEGGAFVYHGSAGGLATTANWTAEGNQANACFGNSVSTAGDVNGVGFSDVIVGAAFYDNGEMNEGRAFVYHGAAGGLATTANWSVEGNQAGAQFGRSVSTAGDVNGDGYSDVIVGADMYDIGETNEGGAFVYYGSSD